MDLLVSVVAGPENTGVERKCYNIGDVSSVDGTLCGAPDMVAANV